MGLKVKHYLNGCEIFSQGTYSVCQRPLQSSSESVCHPRNPLGDCRMVIPRDSEADRHPPTKGVEEYPLRIKWNLLEDCPDALGVQRASLAPSIGFP